MINFQPSTISQITGFIRAAKTIRPNADHARDTHDLWIAKAQAAGSPIEIQQEFLGMYMAESLLYSVAAELAMKLVLQQCGNFPEQLRKSHEIGKLFDAMPADIRGYAEKQYLADMANVSRQGLETQTVIPKEFRLDNHLREAGSAPITLRYITEGNNHQLQHTVALGNFDTTVTVLSPDGHPVSVIRSAAMESVAWSCIRSIQNDGTVSPPKHLDDWELPQT